MNERLPYRVIEHYSGDRKYDSHEHLTIKNGRSIVYQGEQPPTEEQIAKHRAWSQYRADRAAYGSSREFHEFTSHGFELQKQREGRLPRLLGALGLQKFIPYDTVHTYPAVQPDSTITA